LAPFTDITYLSLSKYHTKTSNGPEADKMSDIFELCVYIDIYIYHEVYYEKTS
jgi:hypothetical protein